MARPADQAEQGPVRGPARPPAEAPASPYADITDSPYASVRASPYTAQSPYRAASPYAQTRPATQTEPADTPYRIDRLHSPYQRLKRRIRHVVMVIPPRKPPTGRWWLPMMTYLGASPEDTGDEYDQQASVGGWYHFSDATASLAEYLASCDEPRPTRPACIATVLERGDVRTALTEDPEMRHQLGDSWDRLLPQLQEIRAKLAADPEWLLTMGPGTFSVKAFEWATELGQQYSFTGQSLHEMAIGELSNERFLDACLDYAIFNFPHFIDEGVKLFEEISLQRGRTYFPHAPRQLFVFERFSNLDIYLDGSMGLVGSYKIERTEYWSNLATFDVPKYGAVGWRVHYMVPSSKECDGGAC